jgi:RNA polymerase sigma-70 factor (ECF subfamily)
MDFSLQLARGRAGDPAALEELFAHWRPLLRLQAGHLLGRELSVRLDPSDVVQEALVQAVANLGDFRGQTEGEWAAWLRRLVAGHAAKQCRTHLAGRRSPRREAVLPEGPADPGPSPTEEAVIHERDARLAEAIQGLPDDMRAVIVGRIFRREPFEVLARELGRSPGATRVLWVWAVRRLRQLFPDEP